MMDKAHPPMSQQSTDQEVRGSQSQWVVMTHAKRSFPQNYAWHVS